MHQNHAKLGSSLDGLPTARAKQELLESRAAIKPCVVLLDVFGISGESAAECFIDASPSLLTM